MDHSVFSLLPPVLALGLVILTRRVLLSLGVGIIVGLALHNDFDPLRAGRQLVEIVSGLFVADGGVNTEKVFNLGFLLFLGMTAALITACGGSRAFGAWAVARIRTRRGAVLLPTVLGIVVFIDDYFNALVVGNVSRPVTDRYRISRAKLAYAVDSTSAPVCVLMPISSWGAYIVGILGSILVGRELGSVGALEGFLRTVPVNYYGIVALLTVVCVAVFGLDFGPMRRHERSAGEGTDPGRLDAEEQVPDTGVSGKIRDLVLPILLLVVSTISAMVVTGVRASGSTDPLRIFENTDVPTSLLCGSVLSWLVALALASRRGLAGMNLRRSLRSGVASMLPAIWILLSAWTITEVVDALGTGEYLAGLVSGRMSPALLPLLTFLLCSFMSISTGTSWGTFGIMLPIAAQVAVAIDPGLVFPVLGAVLAGAILGDHCSPISDTTIMSSAGAQCRHIDHVLSQLPYVLVIGTFSAVGYLVLGISGSGPLGLLVSLALLAVAVAIAVSATKRRSRSGVAPSGSG